MKRQITDLAVFGGPAAFAAPLHVGRPNIGDRDALKRRLDDILDRQWLTNGGPYVEELERRIRKIVGAEHCVATSNGTAALEVVLAAAGLSGEVVVPSLTFVATAHALAWRGLIPVFADVDPRTLCLDPARVEELVTPRTSAILGVHLWGRPCDVDALAAIAERHGLALIFDAAQALGCSLDGRPLGTLGDASALSFHATKVCNSFEGGAIATGDVGLADRARLMRNFGFLDEDHVASVGTNAKMAEVAAAMGVTSLESLPTFVDRNRRNHERYRGELEGVDGVDVLDYDPAHSPNYHYVTLDLDAARTGIGRDDLKRILVAENVLARRYFYPGCHHMEPYRSQGPEVGDRLPVTERFVERCLTLPTGMAVDQDTVARVSELVRFAVENGERIGPRLGTLGMGSGTGPPT